MTKSSSETASVNYSVSFGGEADFLGATIKQTTTLTWSNSTTTSSSQQSAELASVSIGGPADGYSGPTNLHVYWDTIYKSFMFAFAP